MKSNACFDLYIKKWILILQYGHKGLKQTLRINANDICLETINASEN